MNTDIGFLDSLRFSYRSFEHKIQQYRLTTNETVIADTESGKIKGVKRISIYDDPYYSFEKIPYAKPPINNLRFKAPEPPEPWTDILDCTQGNTKPMQVHFVYNRVEGSEDCLYLNVYTNNLQPNEPRPVMVWIYGGGFIMGEANRDWYGPDLFMKKDIVLVTINYRLGPLGFLSLQDPSLDIPGNAGLKDQVMALKWVKNNCARFGGNPDNVTVFGESAGAASTNYMAMTEQTNGLFHRAILMSGCVTTQWAITEKGNYAYRLAKATGYSGLENESTVLEYLMKAKARDLIGDDTNLLTPEERRNGTLFCFGPTIEPYVSKHCVIPKSPIEMLKTAWGNKIPIMIGVTSLEGLIFLPGIKKNPKSLQELDTFANIVPKEVVTDRESSECLEMGQKLKRAHMEGENPNLLNVLLEVLSFKHFLDPMHRFIVSRFKHSEAPIYLYRFDFESEELINPYRLLRWGRGVRGVSHADELSYLFHTSMGRKMNKNSKEYKTIERMIGLWSQFATNGDPNSDVTKSVTWKPLEKGVETYKCLNISDEVEFIDLPEMEKIKVWESLYPEELN